MNDGLSIIARLRPVSFQNRRVVGVRWTMERGRRFPPAGFHLTRELAGPPEDCLNSFRLPGAQQDAAGGWFIDRARLLNDRLARRAPFDGDRSVPDLPDEPTAERLIALLTFVLPEDSDEACAAQFEEIVTEFNSSHEVDPQLTLRFWLHRKRPSLADLIAMRNSPVQDDAQLYEAVREHYSEAALRLLMNVARDFGFAKLLGLAFDDLLPDPIDPAEPEPQPFYRVSGDDGMPYSADTTAYGLETSRARAPETITASTSATVIGYPPFSPFYEEGSKWQPAAPPGNPPLSDLVRTALMGPRVYPAEMASLSWSRPPHQGDGIRRALHLDAVSWKVERHIFPARTAQDDKAPRVGRGAPFEVCPGAAAIPDQHSSNEWHDDVHLPWGQRPFEGWHAYRVRGIDFFGLEGDPSPSETVRFRDETAPPPPEVRPAETRVVITKGATSRLHVELLWHESQEWQAPDAAEFRIYQRWTALHTLSVEVVDVLSAPTLMKHLQIDIRLKDTSGADLPAMTLQQCVGGTLVTDNGEYAVLEVSTAAASTIRVRKSLDRAPPCGFASLRYADLAVETSADPARLPRRIRRTAAQTGSVTVKSLAPLAVQLRDPRTGTSLVSAAGEVWLHLLGATYRTKPSPVAGVVILEEPRRDEKIASDVLAQLRALPEADALRFLDGSPALYLPAHTAMIDLVPPAAFASGLLEIVVTAADDVSYQGSATLPGNEGPSAIVRIPAFSEDPPARVPAPSKPPLIWARAAAEYVEIAHATLSWSAVTGAFRYEVERALETALGIPVDADYPALVDAARVATDSAFERRTNHAFHSRWTDDLPGRAPTRAAYRVRAVSNAGIPGEWTLVAIVYVPDVRIPPPANLLHVMAPEQKDRTLACTWTQAGAPEGIGFVIEVRTPHRDLHPEEGWQAAAAYLPGQLMRVDGGRYTVSLLSQQPGLWREFRVIAIRHALDPYDPRARTLREIRGRPSIVVRACAEGELVAPQSLRAQVSAGTVELHWNNADCYQHLEVRRRRPGGYGFERLQPISGTAQSYREPSGLESGEWTYELAAIGTGRRALSDRITIEVT